ncbi:MAG: cupin domain-containing protein [Candidatus Bathyarchaeota archaeon]|jgi:quercetin dioxygenase-like cupin family protein|nr:cupin domain-containing protein [Candidatus Bathyarchaeota archaeon]
MIKFRKLYEEPGEPEKEEGSQGVNSIGVVLKRVDLKAFSSRILRIEPGGHTAFHDHTREHVAVVLRGRCRVETKDSTQELREAMIVTIPSGEGHRFFNPGSDRLALLILNLFTEEESKPIDSALIKKVEEGIKPEGS